MGGHRPRPTGKRSLAHASTQLPTHRKRLACNVPLMVTPQDGLVGQRRARAVPVGRETAPRGGERRETGWRRDTRQGPAGTAAHRGWVHRLHNHPTHSTRAPEHHLYEPQLGVAPVELHGGVQRRRRTLPWRRVCARARNAGPAAAAQCHRTQHACSSKQAAAIHPTAAAAVGDQRGAVRSRPFSALFSFTTKTG
jgi:hypothetical protein